MKKNGFFYLLLAGLLLFAACTSTPISIPTSIPTSTTTTYGIEAVIEFDPTGGKLAMFNGEPANLIGGSDSTDNIITVYDQKTIGGNMYECQKTESDGKYQCEKYPLVAHITWLDEQNATELGITLQNHPYQAFFSFDMDTWQICHTDVAGIFVCPQTNTEYNCVGWNDRGYITQYCRVM